MKKTKAAVSQSAASKLSRSKAAGFKPAQNVFAKSPPKGSILLDDQIWPMEKDIFFRPDRYKYVRKIIAPKGCVFCSAASHAAKFETLCLYRSKYSMIVLNKYPYNSGHLLILPLRHCGDFLALDAEEYKDLHMTLRLAMEACKIIYQPLGFNVGMNHGAVAGAGIPDHLHYHLVPRWAGDLNFFPLIAETKVVIESLEQSYARYSEYFQSI
ncbi:MAG: HIT family protein [Pseudobdellovibrionaceae bacterium]|jgi:ATP adenylyltransferase